MEAPGRLTLASLLPLSFEFPNAKSPSRESSSAWIRLVSPGGTMEKSLHYTQIHTHITSITTCNLTQPPVPAALSSLKSLTTAVIQHADQLVEWPTYILWRKGSLCFSLPVCPFHLWTDEDSADYVSSYSVCLVDRGYGECVFCHNIFPSLCGY